MGRVDNEGKGTIKTDQTFQLSDVKHLGWKIEEKPVLRFTVSTIRKKDLFYVSMILSVCSSKIY